MLRYLFSVVIFATFFLFAWNSVHDYSSDQTCQECVLGEEEALLEESNLPKNKELEKNLNSQFLEHEIAQSELDQEIVDELHNKNSNLLDKKLNIQHQELVSDSSKSEEDLASAKDNTEMFDVPLVIPEPSEESLNGIKETKEVPEVIITNTKIEESPITTDKEIPSITEEEIPIVTDEEPIETELKNPDTKTDNYAVEMEVAPPVLPSKTVSVESEDQEMAKNLEVCEKLAQFIWCRAKHFYKKFDLELENVTPCSCDEDCGQHLVLEFTIRRAMDDEESRKLIILALKDLEDYVNSSTEITKLLKNSCFDACHVDAIVDIRQELGKFFYMIYVDHFTLKSGTLRYYDYRGKTLRTEPYHKAKMLVEVEMEENPYLRPSKIHRILQ